LRKNDEILAGVLMQPASPESPNTSLCQAVNRCFERLHSPGISSKALLPATPRHSKLDTKLLHHRSFTFLSQCSFACFLKFLYSSSDRAGILQRDSRRNVSPEIGTRFVITNLGCHSNGFYLRHRYNNNNNNVGAWIAQSI
jgi:hypothetical protein